MSLSSLAERLEAVVRVARAWRKPEHDARARAVRRTLEAPNRFTKEALAFAVNAAAHQLAPEALRACSDGRSPSETPETVAVMPEAEGAPLAGLRAALAAFLAGHRCRFCPAEASPALVPALMRAVEAEGGREASFQTDEVFSEALAQSDAAIGGGGEEAREGFEQVCDAAAIPPARRFWQRATYSVAVIDGGEDADIYEALAEDVLLYEGHGRASVRLVWVPSGHAPDAFLEAMARFRAVFPAHEDTPGALQMQKAFLDARNQSHAHGDGLEFLMSRGLPEVQARGHLRWAEYDDLATVRSWRRAHADSLHATVAHAALSESGGEVLSEEPSPVLQPGTTHRQLLDAPGAKAVRGFLMAR